MQIEFHGDRVYGSRAGEGWLRFEVFTGKGQRARDGLAPGQLENAPKCMIKRRQKPKGIPITSNILQPKTQHPETD